MTLRFKNSLGNSVQEFSPITEGEVRMYTCGPTVYDYAHIGNFRTYMFEDLLRRWLKYRGYKVIQVMNLTDVDDKTIRESRKAGLSIEEYTKKYKDAFFEDLDTLGIERAEHYPAATQHVPQMVKLVSRLLEAGVGYRGGDDSIYFAIDKFPGYGKLSGKDIEKNISGARIDSDEYEKDQAADFALWKAWSESDGEVFWETELGKGRPGWHIECSAMSMEYLGESFDIHTGGEDNLFPHHENEIAQAEAATGKKFVNFWLHSAHLIVDGKKMSKSLGNFYTLRQLLDKGFDPLAIRYVLLATHYRSQLNFTLEGLRGAETSVERLAEFRAMLRELPEGEKGGAKEILDNARDKFESCLDDDLNISGALGAVFEMVREVNKLRDSGDIAADDASPILDFLEDFHAVTGLLPEKEESAEVPVILNGEEISIEEAIEMRAKARSEKDWETADALRDAIADAGYILKDTPEGTLWRRSD